MNSLEKLQSFTFSGNPKSFVDPADQVEALKFSYKIPVEIDHIMVIDTYSGHHDLQRVRLFRRGWTIETRN